MPSLSPRRRRENVCSSRCSASGAGSYRAASTAGHLGDRGGDHRAVTPLSIRTSEALKAQLHKQGASPMGDFSRAMTVRQFADLLTYLRSVR